MAVGVRIYKGAFDSDPGSRARKSGVNPGTVGFARLRAGTGYCSAARTRAVTFEARVRWLHPGNVY